MKCAICRKRAEYVWIGQSMCRCCLANARKQVKEQEAKLKKIAKDLGMKSYDDLGEIELISAEKDKKSTDLAFENKTNKKKNSANETMYM